MVEEGSPATDFELATDGGESNEVAHAGWDERFAAWILDVIIVWGSLILLGVALRFATGTADEEGIGPEALLVLASYPLVPLYFAFFHAGAPGQTLGKRAAHIAVKDERSLGRLSLGRALGRAYLTALLWVVFYVGGILDGLWPLWDSKNQALHDKAAGSIVVKAPR